MMLGVLLAAAGVVFVGAVAVAFVVLVFSDVRRTGGEPPSPDAQRNLDAHREAEQRVNRGAGFSGL